METTVELLTRTATAISFRVDPVDQGSLRYDTISLAHSWGSASSTPLLAASHDFSSPVVLFGGRQPLVSAVHLAFSQHLPLRLTPDMVWLTMAQGFAYHLVNHSEALRSLLVAHKEQTRLMVKTQDDPATPYFWPKVIDQWSSLITTHARVDLANLIICDFSTTTPAIRTASQVILMHAVREYFAYELGCICGIPWITIEGTVADWQHIRDRVEKMSEYYLEWWTDRLMPICDELIATAMGFPRLSFWQHLYKPQDMYGGDVITGWLADLFPYLENPDTRAPTVRNPILSKPREKLMVSDGLPSSRIPDGVASAQLHVQTMTGHSFDMELLGGFLGVEQDGMTGEILPKLGWGVRKQQKRAKAVGT